ncbi:hypothetical protein ACIHAR_35420 [Streptomyces sp. NPDC052016]|uniref:hypothetical protein n=1 Tax=Streptomyces sp. NPDC052016 TaxID=3365680 RepID=UPI0037CCC9F7
MLGRTTSAPYGRSSGRYARAVAAAVLAVAALITAANAVPAHAAPDEPAPAAARDEVRRG